MPVLAPVLLTTSPCTTWTQAPGLPGSWRLLRSRAAVTAEAADGLTVDGVPVDGLVVLRPGADVRGPDGAVELRAVPGGVELHLP